jgi:Protein of unknown function (DUF2637)
VPAADICARIPVARRMIIYPAIDQQRILGAPQEDRSSPDEWRVPVNGYRPVLARRGFRLAALIAAAICVLVLAAGAFVLSYPGVRDTALAAGVSAHLARFYPGLFDAVFVVGCAAAVTLRGARRGYAWLTSLVVAGAVAAADAVHAMSVTVPKRPLEGTVAVVPWAVLLIGLTLLYAMARQALPGRRTAVAEPASVNANAAAIERPDPPAAPRERAPAPAAVPLSTLLADPADSASPAKTPVTAGATDSAHQAKTPVTAGARTATAELAAPEGSVATMPEPATVRRPPERDDPSDADAGSVDPSTHFNRLHSSPTPPED